MKKLILPLFVLFILSSCVSKKEYATLQNQHDKVKDELLAVKNSLTKCMIDKEKCESNVSNLNSTIADLKNDKKKTLEYVDNLTVLSQGANDNIKETLAQLSKKDKYINRIRAAASKKDSLNLVVAFNLKKELKDGIDDEDIEINVEKTVVFISISDKLLFKSGSYNVTEKAYAVLEKVATVINAQPEMDVMIEGHTDATPIKNDIIQDNWDLSAKRATSITRILQYKFGVEPSRLIAAGRSSYVPLAPNDTPVNKSKNRRTKIIILPKIGQFFEMLETKAE
ncbi:MAG: Motility protein B [Flavobacterium sp. SCGC AAA160-P02]|nr:MAG: Motility protein B [Flavobacterium sp. SCGC AAA160-P02]|tara:strand:- start:237 stop:1082 length:846 start_codon:yes stop_codon:yes gene_type:complete